MQKLGGVVTYIPINPNLNILAGGIIESFRPFVPFETILREFLQDLSYNLINRKESKIYPDIMAFAFWCRRANINKIKKKFEDDHFRLGLGLVFHIAPSNVPVNFAFSFAFGLLSGNANIVRAPSKSFPQVDIICETIKAMLLHEKYEEINSMNAIVQYDQKDDLTEFISSKSNARLIWGGDETIRHIRSLSTPERCIDLAFSDRYSFCVIDTESVLSMDNRELLNLAEKFYNDTYLMDQNACSSPHLIVWLGSYLEKAKEQFWSTLYQVVCKKYDFPFVHAVDKFTKICQNAVDLNEIRSITGYGNLIYRLSLESIPENMSNLKGKFGYFYEVDAIDINQLSHIVNKRYQTLTYFGVKKSYLIDFVMKNRLVGIDNITPIGSALDIGVFWDGYDIVRSLSRTVLVK